MKLKIGLIQPKVRHYQVEANLDMYADRLQELYLHVEEDVRRITDLNTDALANRCVQRPEAFTVVSPEGHELDAWIVRPAGLEPGLVGVSTAQRLDPCPREPLRHPIRQGPAQIVVHEGAAWVTLAGAAVLVAQFRHGPDCEVAAHLGHRRTSITLAAAPLEELDHALRSLRQHLENRQLE